MRRFFASQKPPESWVMPKKLIGVAALPRSGSNYLGDLMTRTDLLGRPQEFFNPHVLKKNFPGRGKTLADCCALARDFGTSSNDVTAIKFFANYFPSAERGLRISEWFGEPAWVWLRRRDMLGQAISYLIARQTQAFTAEHTVKAVPEYSSIRISEFLHKFTTLDAQWRAYFIRTQITPLEIAYEDLVEDPGSVLHRIAGMAGVKFGAGEARPRSTLKKQRTSLNDEWRARFVETMGDPDAFLTPNRLVRGAIGDVLAPFYEPKQGRGSSR